MLFNKVILLTGGTEGIGWACAKAYAAAGAIVCIADKNTAGAEKISQLPGHNHLFTACDVSNDQEVKATVGAICQRYQKLDAIHNNAGIVHPSKPLDITSDEEWNALMNVNLKAILYTTRHGIDLLKLSKGVILNTGSLVGSIGQHNHAAYTATKGAVNALTKSMALDYAPAGIRVNAIAPAAVETEALKSWSMQQPDTKEIQQYLDNLQPLGKMPEADVIADACVFLLSDAARFITGTILPVSGGAELGYRVVI